MTRCTDCGASIRRGWTGGTATGHPRCLVCQTKRIMQDWRYPAAQSAQRWWRMMKQKGSINASE